jgi:hypothetical protein
MILLIEPEGYAHFSAELTEMHRLRYRVFKERLAWTVATQGDQEITSPKSTSPRCRFDRLGEAQTFVLQQQTRIRRDGSPADSLLLAHLPRSFDGKFQSNPAVGKLFVVSS